MTIACKSSCLSTAVATCDRSIGRADSSCYDDEVNQSSNQIVCYEAVETPLTASVAADDATDAEINAIDSYFDLVGGARVHYDKKGRIVRSEDGRGNRREFRRGADGLILEIRESNGLVLSSQHGRRFNAGSGDTEFNTTSNPKIYENGTYEFTLQGGGTLRRELNGCIKVWDSNNQMIEI